jgi:O-antigen/teichoic acid export membrane protein
VTANLTAATPQSQFLRNILWSWGGVVANVFLGFVLSPYMVRQLGDARYGVWALSFAFIEYFWLCDFGMRSAVVNQIASARSLGHYHRLSEILSSALAWLWSVAAVVLLLVLLLHRSIAPLFRVNPLWQDDFRWLLLIVGVGFAIQIALVAFLAALEACQEFRIINRNLVLSSLLRATLSALVLFAGQGLVTLGLVTVGSNVLVFWLHYRSFRQRYPHTVFGIRFARRQQFREMVRFGTSSFSVNSALAVLNQGPVVLIGRAISEAAVGYFLFPSRILVYIVEFVTRIGFITSPDSADKMARGQGASVVEMGITLGRYCFMLFAPICIFLWCFGEQLISVWVKPDFARQVAPLLLPLSIGVLFVTAAQFNSSSILFGLARHRSYGWLVWVETIFLIGGCLLVMPRYGLLGVAWCATSLMLLHRGLGTPFLVCYYLRHSYLAYMRDIYLRPVLVGLPVTAGAFWLRQFLPADAGWWPLMVAISVISLCYYVGCLMICLQPQHRTMLLAAAARLRQRGLAA